MTTIKDARTGVELAKLDQATAAPAGQGILGVVVDQGSLEDRVPDVYVSQVRNWLLKGVAGVTEVLFYHLEQQPLERVLPALVERTLARGWRAVVQAGSEERVEALDTLLWTYAEESFLPHGTRRDGNPALQPVYLTVDDGNPNEATVRFLVDGAGIGDMAGYVRVVYLFDGHDAAAVAQAREHWKVVKASGCDATYWQQSPEGRWEKRA